MASVWPKNSTGTEKISAAVSSSCSVGSFNPFSMRDSSVFGRRRHSAASFCGNPRSCRARRSMVPAFDISQSSPQQSATILVYVRLTASGGSGRFAAVLFLGLGLGLGRVLELRHAAAAGLRNSSLLRKLDDTLLAARQFEAPELAVAVAGGD